MDFSQFNENAQASAERMQAAKDRAKNRSAAARERSIAHSARAARNDNEIEKNERLTKTRQTYTEAQAITNTTQGGSSGTRDDMEVKKKQPSLLKKLQGKRDAKKATNNVAKAAGQSVKNATDNTAGTGSQRKPQPYRQANKTATKGGEITKVGDNKTSAVVKKPASQEIQKVRVKVMQKVQGRPMLGSAQRPDLAGAKPQPQIAGVPAQKQLSANPVRKALPAAKS